MSDRRTPAERAYDRHVDPLGWYSHPDRIWSDDDEAAHQANLAYQRQEAKRKAAPRDCEP